MDSRRAESALRNFSIFADCNERVTIMNEVSLLRSLGQVSTSETGQVLHDFLRDHAREMICEVMDK